MGAPDKFLTDLAACHAADSVTVSYRAYAEAETKFHVSIGRMDSPNENPWNLHYGYGATVDEAMAKARANLVAHYATEAA